MTRPSPEEHAQEHRRYLQVFAWLAVLTAIEIGVIYMPIARLAIGAMLVLLAATKAALVALFFMHLVHEKRTLSMIALTPAILCVLLVIALLPDLGAITRAITQRAPAPAAATGH